MEWLHFGWVIFVCSISWTLASVLVLVGPQRPVMQKSALVIIVMAIAFLTAYVVYLWIQLQRPPLRTLGETRLWYSLFLSLIGLFIWRRWKLNWMLIYSLSMALLFLLINFLKPETHSKTLMPALQSVWFVPHVIVYMFSYALLAASSLFGLKGLYHIYLTKNKNVNVLPMADNLVYTGFAFLTLGLIFGAIWAKEAWGHYWTWDPKETWAFITWAGYLVYIHYRWYHPLRQKTALWSLTLSFVFLLICWFGLSYLPAAQNSVHVYSN